MSSRYVYVGIFYYIIVQLQIQLQLLLVQVPSVELFQYTSRSGIKKHTYRYFRIYNDNSKDILNSVISLQLDLLIETTPAAIVAIYALSNMDNTNQYRLVSQSPTSTAMPKVTNKETLTSIAMDPSMKQNSFSIPLINDRFVMGYLIVVMQPDKFLDNTSVAVLDKVTTILAGMYQLQCHESTADASIGNMKNDKVS
jgi:hypothetical protein